MPPSLWKAQAHLFQKAIFVPQLSKAAKQSQPQGHSEDLPFLCAASLVLQHKLNPIYLDIFFLEFPLYFFLREPKNPNTGNK